MKYRTMVLFFSFVGLAAGPLTAQGMKDSDETGASDSMMRQDTMMRSDAMMAPAVVDRSAYDLAPLGGKVRAFTTEKDAWLLAKTTTVVYFFAATWCPTCQALYRDLKLHAAELPARLSLVFVNYDKSPDLQKKYGVTTQHTFVVVGPQGEKRKTWVGTATVAALVKTALAP